jgi:hypothetical protein
MSTILISLGSLLSSLATVFILLSALTMALEAVLNWSPLNYSLEGGLDGFSDFMTIK